jgi:4-hydroxy-2-oxoheptanedioate aldolase
MVANHVKRRLRAGRPAFGSLLNIGDPLVAEMMASVGFDWLLVDAGPGSVDPPAMAAMVAAITRYGVAPLVRVPELTEASVARVLDAGAWGVLAPDVRTREEAERLVACVARAGEEILVIVPIEHHEAVKNIDAILGVPGVDAFYVGPNDVCASLGLAPALEPPHREFEEAMQAVFAAARRHGVAPGIHCATPDTVNRRIHAGWRMVGMLNDRRFMLGAAQAARTAVDTGAPS